MWAACNVLLAQKMSLLLTEDLHMTFFFFIIISLCQTTVPSAWPGRLKKGVLEPSSKSTIYNLLSPVNFHVAWGDFCLGDQTYISDRNQVTLPIILQFLRTCIISQMHKSYHARIILWVS